MAVPKKRKSHSRARTQRNHDAMSSSRTWYECPQCQEPMRPHNVCGGCGFYRSKDVLGLDN